MSSYWSGLTKEEQLEIAWKFFCYNQKKGFPTYNSKKLKERIINQKNMFNLNNLNEYVLSKYISLTKLPINSFSISDSGITYDDQSDIDEHERKLDIIYEMDEKPLRFCMMNYRMIIQLGFALGGEKDDLKTLYMTKEYICSVLELPFNIWSEIENNKYINNLNENNKNENDIYDSESSEKKSNNSDTEETSSSDADIKVIIKRNKKRNITKRYKDKTQENNQENNQDNSSDNYQDTSRVSRAEKFRENNITQKRQKYFNELKKNRENIRKFEHDFKKHMYFMLFLFVVYLYMVYVLFGMDGFFKIGRHFYSRVNMFYEVMKNITIEMSNVTIRYYRDTHFTNHAGYTSPFNYTNMDIY